jgi:hypothetical protein
LNPGPHGPEICMGSSTETAFEGFEINSKCPMGAYRPVATKIARITT